MAGRKVMAAAIAASLVLSSSGPGAAALAQEMRAISARGESSGAGAQAGALRLPALLAPLSPAAPNASLTSLTSGKLPAPVVAASLSPSAAYMGGHARALPLLASPSLRPAAPERAVSSVKTPARGAAPEALASDASDGDVKSFADEQFRRLGGMDDARVSGAASLPVAAAPSVDWKRRIGLSLSALVGGGAVALAPSGSHAADAPLAAAPAAPAFSDAGQLLGQAGYGLGNALSFVFPVFELRKAIVDRKVSSPPLRVAILVAANLAIGLVNATLAGPAFWFWGIQNTFGAATVLMAWPAARVSRMVFGADAAVSRAQAWTGTIAAAALSLAAGAAVYFAAAAVIPGALTAWLGAASLAKLSAAIQLGAGVAYLFLFLPDILSVMRGQAPHGFTPGFSMTFLLSSLGFLLWSGREAWLAEPGSARWTQFGVMSVFDIVYILVAGASWWLARRQAKAEGAVVTSAPARAPPAAPAAAEPQAAEVSAKEPKAAVKYIHENVLGYRSVRGVVHQPNLGRLPADADTARIIDQISGEFGIARAEVVELGGHFRLSEASSRKEWLFLYDWQKSHNVDLAKRYDSHKYEGPLDDEQTPRVYPEGWRGLRVRFAEGLSFFKPAELSKRLAAYINGEKASYRELANLSYQPGWRGQLRRAGQLHKHFLGIFVRFPYHLFDMFIFGYFRQAIAFEFAHEGEDFFALSKKEGMAKKWLEAGMREQYYNGSGMLGGLRTRQWFRLTERWVVRPVLKPLVTFVARRMALAATSAVAMGMLGAFAPLLPLSFALTAIPVFGPAVVMLLNGLPVAVAAVPFVGSTLAPVFAAATSALVHDLVLGPLLNTLILSTLLTFPAAVRERLAQAKDQHPLSPLSIGEFGWAVVNATLSGSFWRANLKSFVGLATVGAEIEGIMTYAGQIDAFLDPGFEAVFGRKVGLFHSIGAAVERPEGQSPIPFGGAITWGNILLFKLQGLMGFNIADAAMRVTLAAKSLIAGESATDLPIANASAQALIAASGARDNDQGLPFDADLWKRPMDEAMARIKELAGMAGGLDAELSLVHDHGAKLRAELGDREAKLERLVKLSRPVTDAERAEFERLTRELSAKSDEVAVREKLAERRDLLQPPSDQKEWERLEALQKRYEGILPPPPPERNGYWEDLAARDASMKALSQRLEDYVEGREPARALGPASALDPKTREGISALLAEIKALRLEVKGELAQRDATASLLSAVNKTHNRALRERRDGTDMRRIHTDMSKLAVVMDLALALKEIHEAQAALNEMLNLLEARRARIAASRGQNISNQAGADANAANVSAWRADVNKDIAADNSTAKDIADSEAKAGMAAARVRSFQADARAFLDQVNAQDRGASPDAAAEYQRRLDVVLPQIKAWRTNGGNPNDPNAFSLKKFNDNLAEVDDNIKKAQDGLSRLATVPVEYAGTLVALIPGPEVVVSNPTSEQILQILSERRAYWQAKRADFGDSLNTVNRMLDSGNTRSVNDEFGDPHPESLPVWRSQSSQELSAAQTAARQYLSQLDALAGNINRATGAAVPMLSGLALKDLQDAIKTYGDKLKAAKFSDDGSLATTAAQMDLISAAKLVPYAAREVVRWSKAEATITAIDDALINVLPKARAGLTGVVGMLDSVLADVSADEAWVKTRTGGGQELINRKTSLLRDKVLPGLQGARGMLVDTLIPYQRKSIDQVTGTDNDYFKLYDSKKTLIVEATKLYNHTLPWALATFGAADGNQGEASASIAKWRQRLQKNIDGYDDAAGHHKGVREYQVEVANRKDPNFTGAEQLYGETQPFSLPKKITQYSAEFTRRAAEINSANAVINEILGKIETVSKGKYNMSAYRLPVGVSADGAGAARVQAVVDARLLPNLGTRLRAIADEAQAAGGASISIGGGGDGTTPVGTQPAITISDNQTIALMARDVAVRLVPSSPALPESAPAAYAVARFLYSDAVVKAAKDGLDNQIPAAERFLGRISQSLGDAIADIPRDEAYAASNGSSETADAVFARKIRVFSSLDAVLLEGMDFFKVKQQWNNAKFATLDRVQTYYESLHDIYNGGQTANDGEVKAVDAMQAALRKTMDGLEEKRVKVSSWLGQLNPREKSALNNVSEDISRIMEKTLAVLEANIDWHVFEDQLGRSREILRSKFSEIDEKQTALALELDKPAVQGNLPPEVVREIEALRLGRSGWATGGDRSEPASIVIRKSNLGAFIDSTLGLVLNDAQSATQNVAAIKADLLKNPQGLESLIPHAKVLDFGDTADGFYLVYQSKLAVPHGLETGSWVTLGNLGRVLGSNVSVSGYQFASPPSKDGENAPYGDKGVEVQIESLGGKNWVNYLNVDLHRFALDIPANTTIQAGTDKSRLMVFDDFAVMLFGDRLYVGLAGFADGALKDTASKPFYYGGNAKTSLKLSEVMKLNAEQREVFAKDPRKFLQEVNLDFTGYDPELNRNFRIETRADNKHYSRTQVGPQFDLNRLMNPEGGGDAFTLDLYYARTSGTDDVNQQSAGVSILKGFSIKDKEGHAWMRIDNRLSAEKGQKMDEIGDRLSVSFPDQGLVVSGEGRIIGSAATYLAQISQKIGDRATASLSYGSPYVGMNNRLSLTMNTSFTIEDLWRKVAERSAENVRGGAVLESLNRELDAFYKGDGGRASRTAVELQRVFERDVARKLVTQDIGLLQREITELRKAGAVLGNTRVRGMVGFISGPVSNDLAERAVGGGFAAGTYSELSLSKTQKELIASKVQTLAREGLRLQDRLLALSKDWQAAVVDIAEAQWALKIADFAAKNAPSASSTREAQVRLSDAVSRLHQAVLRFNALTGRDPQSAPPFTDLNSEDLRQMLGNISRLIAGPDRLKEILKGLDEGALKGVVGEDPFNLIDWLPWVDRLSLGFGVQFQDMLATQALTVGASLRLPIYDPASKSADKAYTIEAKAIIEEMAQAYAERARTGSAAAEQAKIWQDRARVVESKVPGAASALSDAIRGYRNGLIGPQDLRAAFDSWNWYMSATVSTLSRAGLLKAQAGLDAPFARAASGGRGPLRLTSIDDAFREASANSHSLAEIARRQDAAEEMARSVDHRIKAWLDINVGIGMTAGGVGWLPSIGVTGIPVTPVFGFELKPEEMRELQVKQHGGQAQYYEALKGRVEAGLAVQLYQGMVALRSAQARLEVFDAQLLPRLEAGSDARRLDAAKLEREQANLDYAQARGAINFLLGRPADAPVEAAIDERQALEALSRLLAAKDPIGVQRRILQARVETAKAVGDMIDKNLKVEMLQLEPVSLVVRALGRVIGALSNDPVYNSEHAAAAQIQLATEERERDAYDGRREAEAARKRLELGAARAELEALKGVGDAEAQLKKSVLAARIFTLEAGLLALGLEPDAAAAAPSAALPKSWSALKRQLADSEQALTTVAPEGRLDLIEPDKLRQRSAAYARYYYAQQTLGHAMINASFLEGWVELRLSDPSTPPEVLAKLAELKTAKAERIYRDALIGAAARAGILAAEFEGDVRLLRWIERASAGRGGAQAPVKLDDMRAALLARLEGGRAQLVARLGLPLDTPLSDLRDLVDEDPVPAQNPRDLASSLISEIRGRQIDSIRRTLFAGGVPSSWGSEDGLMQQIKANTIAERMSYKGFTPVAAFGMFRGQPIMGGFLEAPDPRQIESGLEKVMSDVLRKELQSSGRLQELSLRLHALMLRVEDGARGLEARRRLIEAAEADLRARSELSAESSSEYLASRNALIDAWKDFAKAMTETKADFITLVTELEALGEGFSGGLRPLALQDRPEPRSPRGDAKSQLLDYWAGRLSDPSFEDAQDALLARMGPAVTVEQRARVRAAAAVLRGAQRDADGVRGNDYTALERLDRLTRVDVEGKRLILLSELSGVLRGVGLLDPASNPVAAEFLSFMRADLTSASRAFALERGEKVRISRALGETYWRAHETSPAEAASFKRLAALDAELDDARDGLLAGYLADTGEDAKSFVLKDLKLDAYLKAQEAFDAALAKTLEGEPSASVVRALEGLYDLRGVLERSAARARYGRGMAALDALIMLESSRLRAARWTRQTPARIDPIAESLRLLKETRERWKAGKTELEPLYAVTRLDDQGRRTWSVSQWLTAAEFENLKAADGAKASEPGAVVRRGTGWFIDRSATKGDTARYEVVGGVDAAEAARDSARSRFEDNRTLASLHEKMKTADFVAPGELGGQALGWKFEEIFGPAGMHAEGRVFFFEARSDGKPALALHPLAALARPPEEVVMMLYQGDKRLGRERFPTLGSLQSSEEAGGFKTLMISPSGAAALIKNARDLEQAQLRRGWIEVKLNSFGFARDENGELAQLYHTADDFNAEWKSFDGARRDLETAKRDLVAAKAEEAARKDEADAAKAGADRLTFSYQAAQGLLRDALRQAMLAEGLDENEASFKPELERRVALPKFSRLPKITDGALAKEAETRHDAYRLESERMGEAAKAYNAAGDALKLSVARARNAAALVADLERTVVRSDTWSLHRSDELALGLDSRGRVVSVSAPGRRGPEKTMNLSRAVAGGGPAVTTLSGPLLAAVVDADGALLRRFERTSEIDADFKSWTLRSYRAGGDVVGAQGDEVLTKVRFSHYETNVSGKTLPVLLGASYLAKRSEGAKSALWKASHWAYMPYNWGNIPLEVPRAILGIPVEFAGRDPHQSHYLGRAAMYKTEGGSTESHGFARSVLGLADVLNLLPDPVDRFFDPSQFPDKVRVDSALRPGEGLWSKNLSAIDEKRGGIDVYMGVASLAREVSHAEANLEAARLRTLARFKGGVEQLTLETRRGRNGWYQSSTRGLELGPQAVSQRLADPAIGSDRSSEGDGPEGREGDVVTSATPGSLFVDRVERRVRVRPGAESYARQAAALDGYDGRIEARGAQIDESRAALESDLALAKAAQEAATGERADARGRLAFVSRQWRELAGRIGEQIEIEHRIAALAAEIKTLRDRINFWDGYLRLLEEARRHPSNPTDPARPLPPFGPNPMFWAWAFVLFALGSLFSLWAALRRALIKKI